jgi:hypothetical protein
MSPDVVSGKVRQDSLIAKTLPFQNQALLALEALAAVVPASHVETELERHVEARKVPLPERLDSRDVMDTETARPDQVPDLVYADLSRIGIVHGQPRLETALQNGEDQCVEKRPVFRIKRTIDEQAPIESVGVEDHGARMRIRAAGYFSASLKLRCS